MGRNSPEPSLKTKADSTAGKAMAGPGGRRWGCAASVGPGCWVLGVVTSCELRGRFISGLGVVVGDAPPRVAPECILCGCCSLFGGDVRMDRSMFPKVLLVPPLVSGWEAFNRTAACILSPGTRRNGLG